MRAVVYARFSTDKQREASIDDQARVCRVRADRDGWVITAVHSDDGVSGSVPVASRRGGAVLLADAMAGRFDVLLVEGLDRLSRDLVEQERIVRRLEHRGLRIVGVSDGYDSAMQARKLHRGMRGLINEVYLDDLRAKVHRGLDGLVARQLFAGGLPYGYRSIPVHDGHRLEIDEEKAQWVRWIFARYADGLSPQRIAAELNKQGVPSPRGGTWAVSAIYGNRKKTCGILNNPLYAGRYIWNRSQWVKDPDTGKRTRVERPESEWRSADMPDLRIVPAELWEAVKRRQGPTPKNGGGRQARTLLSGLLRCGCCGGAVIAVSQYFYGCAARKDRGPAVCDGVRVSRSRLEDALLGVIRDDLLTDETLAKLQAQVRAVLQERKREARDDTAKDRLEKVEREIRNLIEAVATCGISPALRERLTTAEAERDRLQAELAPASPVPDIIPSLKAWFRALIDDMPKTLARKPEAARGALRDLLGSVTLTNGDGGVWAEMAGCYEGLFARFDQGKRTPATIFRINRRVKVA